MTAAPMSLDRLLAELDDGIVVPQRYSRRSLYGRCEPMIATTLLAFVAIIGSMLACELTRRR
ncbi:hypothetical protein [uncultured Amnibacterium sp.]|uniref:hypothetical protein n=1 Tax=uncultured Amnibacterium sp. TaxID=1631851 RepID=UPI0035CBEAB9